MKIIVDVMNYLLHILETELISASPETLLFIEKEMHLFINKITDILDSSFKNSIIDDDHGE